MTAEAQTTKNFFSLNGGLNTEINELNFPDGFTRDETNYELLVDGSRKRRKGLAVESGAGSALTVPTFVAGEKSQAYVWKNVGGDPNKKVVVYRKADALFFADADETVSDGWATGTGSELSLEPYYTTDANTDNTDKLSVTFTQGRGYLFIGGPYIKSFFVTYSSTIGYSTTEIPVKIRDFGDIEDGIYMSQQPTGAITDDHRYNLRNRGWNETDMAAYLAGQSANPAKSSIWHKGYKRTYGTNIEQASGDRSFDDTKLAAEPFGSSSSPRGSLFLEPYDTSIGYGIGGAGTVTGITTWGYVDTGSGSWTVTITTSANHGIAVGEPFTVEGESMTWYKDPGYPLGEDYKLTSSFNGTHTAITGTATDQLVFTWTGEPVRFASWIDQYATLGSVDGTLSILRSSGSAHGDAFDAIEYHAGRIFYGGMNNQEFSDTIIFSQIAESTEKFGRCFQEADPTDEYFNALTTADGGTLVIPGMGGVMNLVSVRDSLIVLAREGVWEISGGARGVFTATTYAVRKLSDSGASSADGWSKVEDSLVYTGPGGIYVVSPNQFTGQLEVTSATENTIQTLWNQVSDTRQRNVSCVYDNSLRRMYFLLGPDGDSVTAVDTMLIFDARASAWFKYTYDTPTDNVLLCGFAIPNADDTSDNKKMKFIYQVSTTTVQVADFDQTDFDDWDGTNGPLPYLLTGHDNIGDWQRRRQAPIITVFSKRTETGYTDTGNGFDPVNPSSTLLTPYWDWTDDTVTNKVGSQQEVYRHQRNFVPASVSDEDGYPVVVTRNKVRGRGRALQLRFDGATDKDSHIMGFTTNYKVSRRI